METPEPTLLTEEQFVSLQNLLSHFKNLPDDIHYNYLMDCLIVVYPEILIGIETDGYTHS